MPIYSITKEYYEKMKLDIKDKEAEIVEVGKKNVSDMYLEDLAVLKKEIKKIEKSI
jgi:hypothetical protein